MFPQKNIISAITLIIFLPICAVLFPNVAGAESQSPTGWFDGLKSLSNGVTVGGWACDPDDYSKPLTINFYLDGPYPTGSLIGTAVADQSGESAIGTYCGGTTAHRFIFSVPGLDFSQGHDYKIYAYALDYPQTSPNNVLLGGSPAELKSKPLIGALRFDMWFSNSSGLQALAADAKWHYRIPLSSQLSTDNGKDVCVGGVDGVVDIDKEIDAAKRGGIDYWAFEYATPGAMAQREQFEKNALGKNPVVIYPDEKHTPTAFNLYLGSSKRNLVKFTLMIGQIYDIYKSANDTMPDWSEWEKRAAELVDYFKMDNYQKVQGGRPLVYMWYGGIPYTFKSPSIFGPNSESPLDTIRRKARDAGLPEPFFVTLNFFADSAVSEIKNFGYNGISSYGNPIEDGNGIQSAYPYQKCVDNNAWYRDAVKNQLTSGNLDASIVPPINTGWDPRPFTEIKDQNLTYGYGYNPNADYCADPTPQEIAGNLGRTIDWLEDSSNSKNTDDLKSILIYAWNEHVEGGWLAPTYGQRSNGNDYGRLDAIASLLSAKKTQYRYIVASNAACNDQCSISGAKQCNGAASYQTCQDTNGDGCLEWSGAISCASGQTCASGRCVAGCTPTTCASLGYNCGAADDGCGQTLNCGTCSVGQVCASNRCASTCVAKTCSSLGYSCGSVSNGCGATLSCGNCSNSQICDNGICRSNNIIATPPVTPPVINKPTVQMSRSDILAKIQQIQALIADLQKQFEALTGNTTTFSCTQITKNLFYGTKNDPQVKCLQEVLKAEGYAVIISGNYDLATKNAVAQFQQKYASKILVPYGLKYGSGNVGNSTRAKINALIGQ